MGKLKLIYPLDSFYIVQKYGEENTLEQLKPLYAKYGLKGHNGWDFATYHGQKLYATHDGTVTYAGLDGANGYLIVIKTDKQYEYNSGECYFKTLHGHLMPPIPVKAGQKVEAGDLIGYCDNTGASTGDHLHFGLKPVAQGEADWSWYNVEQENGYNGAIDPAPYFDGNFPFTIRTLKQKVADLRSQIAKLIKK